MAPNIVTGFGIRRAYVATPAATPAWVEIPAIISAAFKAEVSQVEQTGNDAILDQWYYGQKGTITVKASRAAMNVFSTLNSVALASFTSYQALSFGRNEELVPPIVAVRGLVIGKDDSLNKIHIIMYWYRVHVKSVFESFPDSQYGKLSEVTMTMISLKSYYDETNTYLGSSPAIGRMEVWVASLSPLSGNE